MSWRFIIVVLLAAAGASAWGGLRLGDWLVAHGPEHKAVTETLPVAVPVLDANGKPFVAQPPQPQVNGRLSVTEPIPPVDWKIPDKSLVQLLPNGVVDLATTTITMDEAKQIAASNGHQALVGIADVSGLDMTASDSKRPPITQPIQPIEAPGVPPPTTTEPRNVRPANTAWQASLRQEILACSALSFFDRPSCAWAARNKYCEPNNAWGKVHDCPAKNF
ncbi:MAG: hypothetical protein EPN46_06995 [Candidimonas sp.]|nr:MAG: hypothetical protein EPN77_18700 [Candidimonas sp.]TAM20057.1 MAG: hypothetical protein EPN62_17245 [Candidimonas sp.]TAM77087.1 MAG: hypothetical protein EPN46_06995 [Candidimonas sp.]